MPNRNYRKGYRYEIARMAKNAKQGSAFRRYASKGVVDICYIGRDGVAHLEQCKFGKSNRPSRKEIEDLIRFASNFIGDACHISIAHKEPYRPETVIRLNVKNVPPSPTWGELLKWQQDSFTD